MFACSLGRALALSTCFENHRTTSLLLSRRFSTSSKRLLPRKSKEERTSPELQNGRRTRSVLEDDMDNLWDQLEEPADVEDSPSSGHFYLQRQREVVHYMRLIEHEMPKLVAYRKPFVPPTDDQPLIVRSMHYQGEPHPAAVKRAIVVPVDKLPLKNETALHKVILLAGPRWSPVPPADSGVSRRDDYGNGYIKISCEDFPRASQNLKWVSDTLDKLIEEANNGKDPLTDVPIDMRHVFSKVKKQKKGDHLGNRVFRRPSINDFPVEWLPQPSS